MMMDPLDFTTISSELWFQQFVALDGLNSGVPTRTTATLTPTTLRNIEQTFLELTSEQDPPLHQAAGQAGFVPPVVHHPVPSPHIHHQEDTSNIYVNTESKGGWAGGTTSVGRAQASPSPVLVPSPPVVAPPTTARPAPARRNMGGRRPIKDDRITPEEEERRKMRRERNKLAAARCRKRRLDHTNELLLETDGLEQKKQCLQNEIQQLQREKEELEFILEAHKPCCRLMAGTAPPSPPDVKPTRAQLQLQQHHQQQHHHLPPQYPQRPPPRLLPVPGNNSNHKQPAQRPSSLNVGPAATSAYTPAGSKLNLSGTLSEVVGVAITTPSAGIPFNFDSLMDGGTGLTPVSGIAPTCSSQQRNCEGVSASAAAAGDLATSPDASGHAVPPKLVSL